jgi:uncharacterized protein YhfF
MTTGLGRFELGYARTELRRRLVSAVLAGEKTASAGLWSEYESEGEPLESPGDRLALLGYDDKPVAVVEITEARLVPAGEIDVEFARDEGEGFASVEDWRVAHEEFFQQKLTPETTIAAVRFQVVERL